MRKKKNPTGLLATLVVLVTVAGLGNAVMNGSIRLPQPGQTPPPPEKAPETKTAADVKANLSGLKTDTDASAPISQEADREAANRSMREMIAKKRNGLPLMALDNPTGESVYQPKPNDSSISTQWYTGAARQGE